jgi:hypothetical protein
MEELYMFVPPSIFTNKNDKRKENITDVTRSHNHEEESNISKGEVKNSQLGIDKEIVHEEKFL